MTIMKMATNFRIVSLVALVIILPLLAVGVSGESRAAAVDSRYVRPKQNPVVAPWLAQRIGKTADAERVRIWVYFTDKGFHDSKGMTAARVAQAVSLTPRAAARRAKVGRNRVEFIDMPVQQIYVDQIVEMDGALRQTSRWLNAASFEIDPADIPSIAALPFVSSITPVLSSKRVEPSPEKISADDGSMALATQSIPGLDYGPSFTQLNQINVPSAHLFGYRGQGVRIAMLDTGFRKDHVAFAQILSEGRLIADSDFVFHDGDVQDEDGIDQPGAHNHGTSTWSVVGGEDPGNIYGPAFEAEFLLAKTEDIRSETPIEEDNWLAGAEWAAAMGADVISSSLGYIAWLTWDSLNGDLAVSTIAADVAASLGIVVCNSIGNSGPAQGTLKAPADADSILAVGAVAANGNIAGFSSRGPTFDGRFKPEVCAMGVSVRAANAGTPTSYASALGTSYACPLVAGAAAVVLSSHPEWTATDIREILKSTASRATSVDNTYGWGIIDVIAAVNSDCASAPDTPGAPSTSNPEPCAGSFYSVFWAPVPAATVYDLYEADSLIYSGPSTSLFLNRDDGSFVYHLVASNDCGVSAPGFNGAATTIQPPPPPPSAPSTSNPSPCHNEGYDIGWSSVTDALAYELYENDIVIYSGSNTSTGVSNGSGSFTYRVTSVGLCGIGEKSPPGGLTVITDCSCHADAVCDGAVNVLDVVSVVNEAFRGGGPVTDATCPHISRSDVNCDCQVNVLDVVAIVNVAFRGFSAVTEFCNSCIQTCP